MFYSLYGIIFNGKMSESLASKTYNEFFLDNTLKVNKTVQIILLSAILIPLFFVIGTLVKLWEIPYSYCLFMLSFEVIVSIIITILNKYTLLHKVAMYFGVISVSIFVGIMAFKGIVRLSISYAFGTIISCLYYNKKLTITTCIINYFLSIGITYFQSAGKDVVVYGLYTRPQYIVQMVIGLTIEFAFLLLIAATTAKLSQRTMAKLMESLIERDKAFDSLNNQNKMIIQINSELEEKNIKLDQTQYEIIQFVAKCLGSHDLFTGRHVIHTQKYVAVICKELKANGFYTEELTEQNIQLYQTAAFLHDIGKIHIPEGILNKIGKFTPEEFEMMKCHPEEGKKLIEALPEIDDGIFNKIAIDMAYCHHEKWDGSGYPRGISGKNIPLCARIMAAADVLDALISQRLYKDPMSIEEAMEVLNKSKGGHFDPCIVDAVIKNSNLIALIDGDFKTTEAATNNKELEWWQKYHDSLEK